MGHICPDEPERVKNRLDKAQRLINELDYELTTTKKASEDAQRVVEDTKAKLKSEERERANIEHQLSLKTQVIAEQADEPRPGQKRL